MRLLLVAPLFFVFRGGGRAMEAAPRVFPPRLLPVRRLFVLCRPSLHIALHVRIRHEVDVAIAVAFEANQHHTWQDGKGQCPVVLPSLLLLHPPSSCPLSAQPLLSSLVSPAAPASSVTAPQQHMSKPLTGRQKEACVRVDSCLGCLDGCLDGRENDGQHTDLVPSEHWVEGLFID